MSGAAVTSIPPEWIDRWRGKPSMRAQNSSQRSQSERPTVEPPRASGGGSGSIRATDDWAAAAPWSARRGAGGSQRLGRPSLSIARPSVARGGGSSWPLSGSTRRPSMSCGATRRSRSAW